MKSLDMRWTRQHLVVGLMGCATLCGACGETVDATGVLVRKIDVTRQRLGPAPSDISGREFVGTIVFQRFKRADVAGDEAEETLVEIPGGKGIAIRDAGGVVDEILTDEYLTDFDTISIAGLPKRQLVLYTYPNSTRGGTFRVVTLDGREVASWTEKPPPGRLAVAVWKGVDTIFYMQNDELVLRSSNGSELSRFPLPLGNKFRSLHIAQSAGDRLIILASGNGYTPYHMVCVYSGGGELLFQEIESEHGFQLDADAGQTDFVVVTRSTRWRYAPIVG